MLMAVGCLLLAVSYWLLADNWSLVADSCLLFAVGCKLLAVSYLNLRLFLNRSGFLIMNPRKHPILFEV
jgi:hypothetical protein